VKHVAVEVLRGLLVLVNIVVWGALILAWSALLVESHR